MLRSGNAPSRGPVESASSGSPVRKENCRRPNTCVVQLQAARPHVTQLTALSGPMRISSYDLQTFRKNARSYDTAIRLPAGSVANNRSTTGDSGLDTRFTTATRPSMCNFSGSSDFTVKLLGYLKENLS